MPVIENIFLFNMLSVIVSRPRSCSFGIIKIWSENTRVAPQAHSILSPGTIHKEKPAEKSRLF
jgi:hypothetical protein